MSNRYVAYLLTLYKDMPVDYIFIDEAHKISEEDSRSAFYYSVIERLCERQRKPRII